ncbi:hypothetical protein CA13_31660 [Planctomycetes bacterium CA13]|uniref:Uncharacterized protein n=1 Tax=Novipirellula herctigrandis TaxID=2527986 RepID=A0A5C5Z572_9BACT|nr:hypothetical protein CA13_31660 [Planctomycetes bacterium CA13]
MNQDDCLERLGLTPPPNSATEIRRILAAQTDLESKSQGDGDQELIKLTCVQLFALGDIADSLVIWNAKQCSFDMSCSIDVQLLCGAGVDETLVYLDDLGTDPASAAATYIRECITTGDFNDFTPPDWLADYRRYYGV